MKIISMAIVFICTLILAILGGILIAFTFNLFTLPELIAFFQPILQLENLHLIIGGIGLFLVFSSIATAQICFCRMQREKTIAFNNPSGQVTVSLVAIEDFIRRLATSIAGIRDLRSNVIAGKKGIEINTRVSLWADVNIPETTENIQSIIRARIQEMLGIEEPIEVKVHVSKIVQKEKKNAKKKADQDQIDELSPFRGNIEYGKD